MVIRATKKERMRERDQNVPASYDDQKGIMVTGSNADWQLFGKLKKALVGLRRSRIPAHSLMEMQTKSTAFQLREEGFRPFNHAADKGMAFRLIDPDAFQRRSRCDKCRNLYSFDCEDPNEG